MQGDRRAIVIGGGIGGLSAAIALRRAGIDAAVFEQAGDLKAIQVGAGLFFWPNAVRAVQRLGLEESLRAVGAPVERFELRTWRGDPLVTWPVGDMGRRLDAHPLTVTRPELHSALVDALDEGVLQLGTVCTGFEQDATGVTARFADGREERGDVLIGADGLRSVVRAQLRGEEKPRYVGYTAWRGIVAEGDHFAPETVTVYWGPGARLIAYRVTGERPYWLALANAREGEGDSPAGRKADVLARYRDWPDSLLAAIEAADESAIHRADIHDRPPIERWGEGRVSLLGDAAHPTTPNLAQGAAYAIEDAVVLARSLGEEGDAETALRRYEERRVKRAASMVKGSYRMGTFARWERPLALAARERFLKTMMNSRFFRKGLERDLDVEL